MDHPGASAGLQTHWYGVFKNAPWPGWKHTPARGGPAALERAERRDKALTSASRRNSATGPERKAAGPWGCERCPCLAGCHARLRSAGDQSAADTVKDEATRGDSTPTAFAGSGRALGDVRLQAVRRLSTQVVRNTGERLIVDNRARCMRSRRQRFPTVRMHDQIGNGEARAKTTNIRACTSTAERKRANLLEIHYVCL